MQGFDGYGATATLWGASDAGFTLSGVWGEQDDFAVLQLWEMNNQFEHPRLRYLPDGDFSGISLAFDLAVSNCERIDSTDYPAVDWPYLDVLVGSALGPQYATEHQVKLSAYATPNAAYGPASVTFTLTGAPTAGDYIELAWGEQNFNYLVTPTDTLATAAAGLAAVIQSFVGTTGVSATAGGAAITLVYTAPNANQLGVYGSVSGARSEGWSPAAANFTGGTCPSMHVVINFAGTITDVNGAMVATTNIQRMWLTFAPPLPLTGWLPRGDWSAVFSNWTVTDGTGCSHLQVAAPGSVRIEENSRWVARSGYWEAAPADGFAFWSQGLAIRAAASGAALTVETHCQFGHTIYVGTRLDTNCGIVSVSVDGGAAVDVDCYGAGIQVRVPVATVAAGQHSVVITLTGTKNAGSGGYYFYFDFLECAVLGDVPDAPAVNGAAGLACDFDTNNTYMLSPERLVWGIERMGLTGEIDHYMGVFWWPVRTALEPASSWAQTTVIAFTGTPVWAYGNATVLNLGTGVGAASIAHPTLIGDTAASIATTLAQQVNQASSIFWAEVSGATLTLHGRASSANYYVPVTVTGASGTLAAAVTTTNGTAPAIAAGWYWGVDATATAPVNTAVAAWHADYFAQLVAAGLTAVVSLSQELVNPPSGWAQLFHDGTPAATATGFGTLNSTQIGFGAAMQAYMASAYAQMGALMVAAGLAPRLQFGEILWWYQAGGSPASMAFYDAATTAAATAALGRALAVFSTPNDSPAVNAYADANFLRARLEAYVGAVRTAVLAACPTAVFELLWPLDVNDPATCQLMRYVNLPTSWTARTGSGFDTFVCEGLSYCGVAHNLDQARTCAEYPYSALGWDKAHCRYLEGWYYSGWPWQAEYRAALGTGLPLNKFWAIDHLCLYGWTLPLPVASVRRARVRGIGAL